MELAQLAQLKAMSQSERLGYYFKKLVNKEITREKYDKAIKFLAKLAAEEAGEKDAVVVADMGEPRVPQDREDGMAMEPVETGSEKATNPPPEGTSVTPMEFVSALSLPRDTDGNANESGGMHPNPHKGKSQKARMLEFLSDGQWHSTIEIQNAVYGANHLGSAAIPSRISELRNKDGYTIESNALSKSIWEYRLVDAKVQAIANLIGGA